MAKSARSRSTFATTNQLVSTPRRASFVNVSFGVVIPVRNAELQLSPVVHEVLDILSELTTRFDLLIVDDASTDHTSELAHDMAKQYPQIRVVSHQRQLGLIESARRGVQLMEGNHVVLVPGQLPVDATGLRRAWREFSESGRSGWNRQSWGTAKLSFLPDPVYRRAGARPGELQRRWQRWGILTHRLHGALRTMDRSDDIPPTDGGLVRSERPDTVGEQRTAPLIPIRRSRPLSPPPSQSPASKAAGTGSENSSSNWQEKNRKKAELTHS